MTLTALSLFTGLGGLDLGLEAAGFSCAGCIEIDDAARRSLKINRGDDWPLLEPYDVRAFAATVGGVDSSGLAPDLIAGAPPCQPFSKAGQWESSSRLGIRDDRGTLLYSVLQVMRELQPRAALLENVPGFISGPTSVMGELERGVAVLNAHGGRQYELHASVLDAHAYGTPQRRRRAIVVIIDSALDWQWPAELPESSRPVAWDALKDLSDVLQTPGRATGKWADLLPSIPEGRNYQHHTDRGAGMPLFGYRTRYWSFLLKLAKAEPAWTLQASPGPATGPFHWDSRPLTVREALRLQSFPSTWQVKGTTRDQIRQVGNATPPALAEAVGRQMRRALGGGDAESDPIYAVQRRGKIPRASTPGCVPTKYLDQVTQHQSHPGVGLGPAPRV